jgi:hypothetical protein
MCIHCISSPLIDAYELVFCYKLPDGLLQALPLGRRRAKAVADDHFRRLAFGAKKTASALLL